MLILLMAACLTWVGILSLASVMMSWLAYTTGWIVAGGLVCAVIAWLLVMVREIRDAVELPDFFAEGQRQEGYDESGESTEVRPCLSISQRMMMSRRSMTPFRSGSKSRPRKLRSHWEAVSEASSR